VKRPDWLRSRRDIFREVFSGPRGERALRYILKMSGIGKPVFSTDPNIMYFRSGRQEIGFRLITQMQLTDDQVRVLTENDPDE
jgi:hypothetical protein